MKICFIILAHHQPNIFHKLIRQLSWENSDIIVHIDKRSDIKEFELTGHNNIHFVKKRRRVHWCGWSLTRTMIELLEHALKVSKADYFIYLAGTDLLVKNRLKLLEYLTENYPANFLNFYPLVPGIWGYGLINRYRLVDLKAKFINPRNIEQEGVSKTKIKLAMLVSKIEKALNSRFQPRNTTWTDLYHGSSRWCLNRETVQYLVRFYRSKSSGRLKNYLRLSANSDEIFIQTAILNSAMKKYCIGFNEVEMKEIFAHKRQPLLDEIRVYLHYIDWSTEREDPAILVESDFDAIQNSGKFFACKFTDEKSFGLVKLIEKNLNI